MLTSSAKAKGKLLEKYVAEHLKKFLPFAYSRADSGSGKYYKEDVSIPDWIPLHIECKNHATLKLQSWYDKAQFSCPGNKYTIVIFKQNYQKTPKVYLRLDNLMSFMSGKKVDFEPYFIIMEYDQFEDIVRRSFNFYNPEKEITLPSMP